MHEQAVCLSVVCPQPLRIRGGLAEELSRCALALAPTPTPQGRPGSLLQPPWEQKHLLGVGELGSGQTPEVYSSTLASSPPDWAYLS